MAEKGVAEYFELREIAILETFSLLAGAWSQIGVYTPTSSTGTLIQQIGGQRYVFIDRGSSPCPMEVLSYPGMEKIGELYLSEHPVNFLLITNRCY